MLVRSLAYYLSEALDLVAMMFQVPKCKELLKNGRQREYTDAVTKTVSQWGKRRVLISGAKLNIIGLNNIPKDRTVLFVSNHQSDFDIPVFLHCIPGDKAFVAKKELEKVPLLGYWMKMDGCLFLDRKDIKQSVGVIMQAADKLKEGMNMVIFPEGTRSKGGPVKEFKAGSFKPAIKAGVPIVPVTLDGTYKVIEGTPKYIITPAEVNVVIHPPIETAGLSRAEIKELPERVRQQIIDAMQTNDNTETEFTQAFGC